MHTEILFNERQRFKQLWVWAILIIINGLLLYGVITQILLRNTSDNAPSGNTGLILIMLLVLSITLLILFIRLDTKISKDGVYYRFLPFQKKFRKADWDSIDKSYIRKYKPIIEYGGWGMRTSLSGDGKAYNISGNEGLQLVYHNGKKFLLGTRQPEEMRNTLKRLGMLSNEKLS